MDVSMGHDTGDVPKKLSPGIFRFLVPFAMLLQVGLDCMHKDGAHDAQIVTGNADVSMKATKSQQIILGLKRQKRAIFSLALISLLRGLSKNNLLPEFPWQS